MEGDKRGRKGRLSSDGDSPSAEAMEGGVCQVGAGIVSLLLQSHFQRCVSSRQDDPVHAIRWLHGCKSSTPSLVSCVLSLTARSSSGLANVALRAPSNDLVLYASSVFAFCLSFRRPFSTRWSCTLFYYFAMSWYTRVIAKFGVALLTCVCVDM